MWSILWGGLLLAALILGLYSWHITVIAARSDEVNRLIERRTLESERRRRIAEGLREILVMLNSERSLAESLHYIVAQAAQLTDAEDAIIFSSTAENPMTIVATNPGGHIQYTPGESLQALTQEWATEMLPQKRPLIIPELARYWSDRPQLRPVAMRAHRALLGVPLFVEQELYGGLLMFYERPRSFSDDDLHLGETFADQAALAIANARLKERVEQTAVAAERNRLARDLHDAVTQTLFSASLIAEALPPLWEANPEEGQQLLQELRQLTRGALAEMRTLLLELRPAALAETRLPDLLKQLGEAVTGRAGIPVHVAAVDCDLPVQVRVALYRIAQEALNNVVKHARATEVVVHLAEDAAKQQIRLCVQDNGRGFNLAEKPSGRLGLKIIRERAQAIGAVLHIKSELGQGTEITAVYDLAYPVES
ncbi:MAG: GAF domain-containing sensor histidine kinase [Chloroflexota bacterium]|nr:GAF domain-containing sensor histidine kinase [Anaerolineales bacterium]